MRSESTAIGALESARKDEGSAAEAASQYVAFRIGEQEYCVDIMSVREIRTWTGTTPLPNTADFVRGVINLRGIILPIIDLRARFGQGDTDPTKNHVVVIVAVGRRLVGLLVDAVLDILAVHQDEISAVPDTGGEEGNPYLDGLVTQNERMVAMIALDQLVEQAIIQ